MHDLGFLVASLLFINGLSWDVIKDKFHLSIVYQNAIKINVLCGQKHDGHKFVENFGELSVSFHLKLIIFFVEYLKRAGK
uniref:Uncharacterized protein n=1 Tax=Kalanchoe fedtschenkoi TaxID=63787 RepID=A0A7N0VKC5_KALFE